MLGCNPAALSYRELCPRPPALLRNGLLKQAESGRVRQSQAEVWAFLFFAATDAGEYQVFMQVDPPLFKGDQVA